LEICARASNNIFATEFARETFKSCVFGSRRHFIENATAVFQQLRLRVCAGPARRVNGSGFVFDATVREIITKLDTSVNLTRAVHITDSVRQLKMKAHM